MLLQVGDFPHTIRRKHSQKIFFLLRIRRGVPFNDCSFFFFFSCGFDVGDTCHCCGDGGIANCVIFHETDRTRLSDDRSRVFLRRALTRYRTEFARHTFFLLIETLSFQLFFLFDVGCKFSLNFCNTETHRHTFHPAGFFFSSSW